jgi:predicted amidohydrolase
MFRVSCIQLKSNNNILHNLKKTEELIFKAVKQKTDFILTPEISSVFSLEKKKIIENF